MVPFTDIIRVLDASVDNSDIGAHGRFWRSLSRDEFVEFQVFGQIPLLAKDASGNFDPDNSNLVKALEGRAPFGRDIGSAGARFPRMPVGFPPMASGDIQLIRGWIAQGCPT